MRLDRSEYPPDAKQAWDADWERIKVIYYWHLRHHYQVVEQYLHGSVLDIGCGPGYLAARCFPNEGHYTGVDISIRAIALGRQLFPAAHFVEHDAEHQPLPFKDNNFDTVVASEIVEHVMDPTLLLSEARRVSRQFMVFTVPTSMAGVGHVRPTWEWADVIVTFGPLGHLQEVRYHPEARFWLIWLRK